MSKPKGTFFAGTDGLVYFRSYGYVPEFPEEIKKNIKGKLKSWHPDKKLWSCDPSILDLFSEIASRYYDCTFVKDESSNSTVEKYEGDAYSEFLRCLPDNLLKKIYFMVVSEIHPDKKTGNQDLMSKINSLWNIIKKDKNIK